MVLGSVTNSERSPRPLTLLEVVDMRPGTTVVSVATTMDIRPKSQGTEEARVSGGAEVMRTPFQRPM